MICNFLHEIRSYRCLKLRVPFFIILYKYVAPSVCIYAAPTISNLQTDTDGRLPPSLASLVSLPPLLPSSPSFPLSLPLYPSLPPQSHQAVVTLIPPAPPPPVRPQLAVPDLSLSQPSPGVASRASERASDTAGRPDQRPIATRPAACLLQANTV